MRIIRGLPSVPPERRPSAVALGVFDGVHLGHRAILGAAVAHARATGSPALACTFEPHPLEVLQPDRAPLPITTLDERLALIGACGVDGAVVLDFTRELAAVEPEAFVKDVLVDRLAAQQVIVGFHHRFGRGAGRGRTLGFPTANVAPDRPVLVAPGVYACQAEIGGQTQRAVVNVGVRPTFGEDALAVEAYLLDFSGDVYGQTIRLLFVSRLREEKRFPRVDALRAQIAGDVDTARRRP